MTISAPPDWIYVPIPKRRYADVLRLLTDTETESAVVGWTEQRFRELRPRLSETIVAMLDLCAESPGAWIPRSQIEERADRSYHEARADMSAFTKLLRSRYGSSLRWPVEVESRGDGDERQAHYWLDEDIADSWVHSAE